MKLSQTPRYRFVYPKRTLCETLFKYMMLLCCINDQLKVKVRPEPLSIRGIGKYPEREKNIYVHITYV